MSDLRGAISTTHESQGWRSPKGISGCSEGISGALVAIFGIYARFCGEWWHREPLGQFWGLVSVGLCVAPSGGGVAPKFYQKMVSPNIATLPKIQKTFCAQKMDFLSIGQKDAQGSVPEVPGGSRRLWEAPEGSRRLQEAPGGSRRLWRPQTAPGGFRRPQQVPAGLKRLQSHARSEKNLNTDAEGDQQQNNNRLQIQKNAGRELIL